MKKRLTQILALSVLVVLCLSTSTLATARRASLYLNDYYVNSATLSGGRSSLNLMWTPQKPFPGWRRLHCPAGEEQLRQVDERSLLLSGGLPGYGRL